MILIFASFPFYTEANSSFQTDLTNGLLTKSDRLTFDLWVKDDNGNKINGSDIIVTNNGNPVPINWDDTEKTSYTLALEVGVNTVRITYGDEQWQYTLHREAANDGDVIGHFIFSLDAFSLGLGYLIEPIEVPIIKGRTAAEELDAILRSYGFTYKSTGSLTSGFYLATIYKDDLFNQPIAIPNDLKIALSGLYDEQDFSPATGLGEFDFNYMSGWMYAINNTFPNVGFADKFMLDGDVMRVQFTLAYGQDIGGGEAMGESTGGDYFLKVNKDALTRKLAQINTAGKSNYLINSTRKTAYTQALQTIAKMNITQDELDAALAQLQAANQVQTQDASEIEEQPEQPTVTIPPVTQENTEVFEYKKAANRIISQIEVLPNVNVLTLADLANVEAVRQAYNLLSLEAKNYVSNYMTLLAAEQQIEELQQIQIIGVQAIQQLMLKIDTLPALILLEHEPLIKEARQGYDVLTSVQQQKIANYSTLLLAELALEKLQAPAVEEEEKQAVVIDGNIAYFRTSNPTFDIQIDTGTLQELYKNNTIHTLAFEQTNGPKIIVAKDVLQNANAQHDLTVTVQTVTIGQSKQWSTTFTGKNNLHIPLQLFMPTTIWKNGYLLEATKDMYAAVPHFEEQQVLTASIQSGIGYTYTTKAMTFSDIANHANKLEIDYLASRYVIQGTDGLFNPSKSITRAQFAAMIARALGVTATKETAFTDIKGQWYEQDIQALFEAGIVNGTSDTTFTPTAPLSRQHAAAMMARVLRYAELTPPKSYTLAYQDAAIIGKSYAADISWLHDLNIMSGSNGMFSPKNHLTRAQMAKILKRTLNTAKIM